MKYNLAFLGNVHNVIVTLFKLDLPNFRLAVVWEIER